MNGGDDDKPEYNNREFIEQLKAISDQGKISMDELNILICNSYIYRDCLIISPQYD